MPLCHVERPPYTRWEARSTYSIYGVVGSGTMYDGRCGVFAQGKTVPKEEKTNEVAAAERWSQML